MNVNMKIDFASVVSKCAKLVRKFNKRAESGNINIVVKSDENIASFNDYLKYRLKYYYNFFPGIKNNKFYIKIPSASYYLIILFFLLELNIIPALMLYSILLTVSAFRFNKFLKKQNLKIDKHIKVLKLLTLITSISIMLFAVLLATGQYKSKFLGKLTTYISGKIINSESPKDSLINKEILFDISRLISGKDPLPYLKNAEIKAKETGILNAVEEFNKVKDLGYEGNEIYYWLGKIEVEKGNIEEAYKYFNISILKNSKFAPAVYEMANVLILKNNLSEANNIAKQAIKLDDKDAEAYRIMAKVFAAKGLYSDAIKSINIGLNLKPADPQLYRDKAWYMFYSTSFKLAQTYIERSIAANGEDALSYYTRGYFFYRAEEYQNAISDFDKSYQLDSRLSQSKIYSAIAALRLSTNSDNTGINEALKIGINNPEVHFIYAEYLNDNSQNKKALEHIDISIKLDKNKAKYFALKAKILLESDEFSKVNIELNNAERIDNNDWNYTFVNGLYKLYLGDYIKARDEFLKAKDKDKFNIKVLAYYSLAQNFCSESSEADYYINEAFKIGTKDTDKEKQKDYFVNYILSEIYYQRKELTRALGAIKKSIESNQMKTELYLQKAKILSALGENEESEATLTMISNKIDLNSYAVLLLKAGTSGNDNTALVIYDKIIKKYPDAYVAYVEKAERLMKLNNFQEALLLADKALELNDIGFRPHLIKYQALALIKGSNTLKEVSDELDVALKINPYFQDLYYYKAIENMRNKNFKEARINLETGIKKELNYYMNNIPKINIYERLIDIYKNLGEDSLLIQARKNYEIAKFNANKP